VRDTIVLGRYIVGTGTLRFVIEFIRVNGRVALGLSVAHLVSLVAIVVGIGLLVVSQPARRAALFRPEPFLMRRLYHGDRRVPDSQHALGLPSRGPAAHETLAAEWMRMS
jgi:prolipoprotein diacylglyceryl transferase